MYSAIQFSVRKSSSYIRRIHNIPASAFHSLFHLSFSLFLLTWLIFAPSPFLNLTRVDVALVPILPSHILTSTEATWRGSG